MSIIYQERPINNDWPITNLRLKDKCVNRHNSLFRKRATVPLVRGYTLSNSLGVLGTDFENHWNKK